ncbi:MAG: 2-oxoacid:acceptor oxidoreductase family protein [Candidatus Methanomethylicia archaeon]
MVNKIRICGFGGQGILVAGEVLGMAAMIDGKNAVEVGSYGAEARGTITTSDVIISDEEINFPLVDQCDILIALCQQAFDIHKNKVSQNGIIIVDEELVKIPEEFEHKSIRIKATKIAEEKFNRITANMIVLGYLASKTRIVSIESLKNAVKERITKMVEINMSAIEEGAKLAYKDIKEFK